MSMPRLDWSNIDKAIARGDVIDPRAWEIVDRAMPRNRAGRPSEDVGLTTQANEAIQRLHQNVARLLNAASDLSAQVVSDAPDEPTVNAVLEPDAIYAQDDAEPLSVNSDRGVSGDQMEWLTAQSDSVAVDAFNTFVTTAATLRVAELTAQHSPRQPSALEHERSKAVRNLLSTYSMQKRAVWEWLERNTDQITEKTPKVRDLGAVAGVSYETARLVLKDFRNLGLTSPQS
jgi:hypothetical protein